MHIPHIHEHINSHMKTNAYIHINTQFTHLNHKHTHHIQTHHTRTHTPTHPPPTHTLLKHCSHTRTTYAHTHNSTHSTNHSSPINRSVRTSQMLQLVHPHPHHYNLASVSLSIRTPHTHLTAILP